MCLTCDAKILVRFVCLVTFYVLNYPQDKTSCCKTCPSPSCYINNIFTALQCHIHVVFLQWNSRVAWRHVNICFWCASLYSSSYFVTLFLLTVWIATLIWYHLSFTHIFKMHTFPSHSTVNHAWCVPSVFTPCTSSTSAKFVIKHILENCESFNLTKPFQTPAFSLGPDVIRRPISCYSKVSLPENYTCLLILFNEICVVRKINVVHVGVLDLLQFIHPRNQMNVFWIWKLQVTQVIKTKRVRK